MISFAGFRLLSKKGRPLGVMALFSRHPIQPQDEVHLRGFATTTSQVILEGMAEEALARSEEKYRSLFANAQVGMYRTSLDGSALREANQKLADIFGYSVAELLSAPTAVDMLWASPDAYHELLRRLFEKGLVTDYEFQIITKRGEVRTCLTSIKLFRQEGYLEGSMIDITERKRTEEALHRANQMLRVVLDTIPARVFWKDRQLRYLGGNRLFVADAGYADPTELVGKDDFAILGKETAEHYRAQDESVMASDTPALASEEMAAGPDGTQRWLRVNKVPLHDSQGAVIGLLGTYEDITERKAATEALSAAKERLERASTAGNVALWEWDIESGTLEWSGAIDAMLGFGKGKFTRTVQAWNAILHPDDRLRVLEALKRHLRDNEPFEMDYRVCRADGASLWWHTTGSSQRDGDGRAIRMTGACIDVTERKKAEEERLALERRLQQARKTESLGRMAGAVAHHFNNKLGAILGSLELAQADLPPESKIGKHLSRAMTASFQAAKISRLMLAYWAMRSGRKSCSILARPFGRRSLC